MKCRCVIITILVSGAMANWSFGGIPEPSALLYGTISIDGLPVSAADDVTVIARVDGVLDAVGSYHMGDNPGASGQCTDGADCYALRLRLENLADGSSQSDDAALVSQTAHIYVQDGAGPELLAAEFVITDRGMIENVDLDVSSELLGDIDGDGDVDFVDLDFFVGVLVGTNADPDHIDRSDLDSSGTPNGLDISLFVNAMVGP